MTASVHKPSFFVVGAPKCGTTAVNEYFRQHPEVFVPRRQKDLAYFGDDLRRSRPRETKEEYLSYYRDVSPGQRPGEVCVWYLYSEAATEELHDFCPDAEIFVMVRNPVDLAYSQHSQMVFSRDEDLVDFDAALAAESDRRHGRRLPPTTGNRPFEGLQYRALGHVSQHIVRYRSVFGDSRVHVIVYDDFKVRTAEVMAGVFRILGVSPTVAIDYRVYNGYKTPRSEWLQTMLRNPPERLSRAYRQVTPERLHGRPLRALVRWNTRYASRPPLDPGVRRRLQAEFAPEVDRLSSLLGRDLSHWCTEREPGARAEPLR